MKFYCWECVYNVNHSRLVCFLNPHTFRSCERLIAAFDLLLQYYGGGGCSVCVHCVWRGVGTQAPSQLTQPPKVSVYLGSCLPHLYIVPSLSLSQPAHLNSSSHCVCKLCTASYCVSDYTCDVHALFVQGALCLSKLIPLTCLDSECLSVSFPCVPRYSQWPLVH